MQCTDEESDDAPSCPSSCPSTCPDKRSKCSLLYQLCCPCFSKYTTDIDTDDINKCDTIAYGYVSEKLAIIRLPKELVDAHRNPCSKKLPSVISNSKSECCINNKNHITEPPAEPSGGVINIIIPGRVCHKKDNSASSEATKQLKVLYCKCKYQSQMSLQDKRSSSKCRSVEFVDKPSTTSCKPKSPPCKPKSPTCKSKAPPSVCCNPKPPPCKPKPPPCKPKSPPCKPKSPPCKPTCKNAKKITARKKSSTKNCKTVQKKTRSSSTDNCQMRKKKNRTSSAEKCQTQQKNTSRTSSVGNCSTGRKKNSKTSMTTKTKYKEKKKSSSTSLHRTCSTTSSTSSKIKITKKISTVSVDNKCSNTSVACSPRKHQDKVCNKSKKTFVSKQKENYSAYSESKKCAKCNVSNEVKCKNKVSKSCFGKQEKKNEKTCCKINKGEGDAKSSKKCEVQKTESKCCCTTKKGKQDKISITCNNPRGKVLKGKKSTPSNCEKTGKLKWKIVVKHHKGSKK